jgi:4-amino-4-deoxy-L-arabinose transferase-like glycosyltransferase
MPKLSHSLIHSFIFFVFALAVLYPLIEFIDALPIYLWDESRQAANAIEMYSNHKWIVTYYDGSPDMWNTKPPLLIWLQVLSMNFMGCTVLALRIPSVLAAFITTLLLFYFIKKETGNIWIAFFSGIVLVSMEGFNGIHVARTADYDALLLLFTMMIVFQFYYYLQTFNKKNIILFFVFLSLGSLTKGVAALLFLPGFFLYACIHKKTMRIVKDPYFYVGCFIYVVIIGSYYISREQLNPGYLNAVYMNELGGRFLEVNEGHDGNAFSYIKVLSAYQTYFWFDLFLVLLIICPFLISTFKYKKLFQYFLILTVCFITILTIAKTKIAWYTPPALPLIACMCILLLINLFKFSIRISQINVRYEKPIILFVISIFCVVSYIHIAIKNYHPKYEHDWKELSIFLHKPPYPIETLNLKIINHTDFRQLFIFYVKRLQLINPTIDFGDYKKLNKGEDVLVADETINKYIRENYVTHKLYNKDNVYIYSIK